MDLDLEIRYGQQVEIKIEIEIQVMKSHHNRYSLYFAIFIKDFLRSRARQLPHFIVFTDGEAEDEFHVPGKRRTG